MFRAFMGRIFAGFLGLATLGAVAPPASAFTLSSPSIAPAVTSANIDKAQFFYGGYWRPHHRYYGYGYGYAPYYAPEPVYVTYPRYRHHWRHYRHHHRHWRHGHYVYVDDVEPVYYPGPVYYGGGWGGYGHRWGHRHYW